jgi:hypothetical protein
LDRTTTFKAESLTKAIRLLKDTLLAGSAAGSVGNANGRQKGNKDYQGMRLYDEYGFIIRRVH